MPVHRGALLRRHHSLQKAVQPVKGRARQAQCSEGLCGFRGRRQQQQPIPDRQATKSIDLERRLLLLPPKKTANHHQTRRRHRISMIHCMCSTYSYCEHSIVRHVGYALDKQQPAVLYCHTSLCHAKRCSAMLPPPARPPVTHAQQRPSQWVRLSSWQFAVCGCWLCGMCGMGLGSDSDCSVCVSARNGWGAVVRQHINMCSLVISQSMCVQGRGVAACVPALPQHRARHSSVPCRAV